MNLGAQHFQTKDTMHGKLLILPAISEPTFVMFHTDSCGVCQQVMPVYHQIARQLPFRFATCNLSKHGNVLAMSENTISPITHVPRLYLYAKGWPFLVYKDGWQPEKLVQFMKMSWQRALDQGAGGGGSSSQQQPQNPNPNPSQQAAYSQFNPNAPQQPHLPGRIVSSQQRATTTTDQDNNRPSQYAAVEGAQSTLTSNISCDGDNCGELLSFNEVLCDKAHGCYTVMDMPEGGA